jgi:hypothetical protein
MNMTEHDFELLSRYLDGELPAAETQKLERRLADEPQLRQTLDKLQRIDHQLQDLSHAPGCDRVPAHIAALLAPEARPAVLPFPERRGRAAIGLAVAASVVAAAGLLLAPQWRDALDGLHPADASSPLVAAALEETPSSAEHWVNLSGDSRLRPVLSFAGAGGQWCREYQFNQEGQQWHGIACRDAGTWRTEVLVSDSGPATSPDYYQPAGAGDLDAISSYINEHATDIPLSAGEEAALIANDWR